ncbi:MULTISPECIES: hypothetical protein [Flavobacteriaceae]|uniref:Uncharacterized protein n=2 Tax=Flavobacteriaceae TaxID=49546 RepID=A0A4Y8ATV0_9FLAO|nr:MULTISPECIES: hypothetical protein [Flavobacteriaceae]TEW74112.1 hypothetical protein E2488_11615 [Gramella jeungdoensis]GGK40395.1 hypothetical protein GCM10007963_05570 [Lutibacter litoralis]
MTDKIERLKSFDSEKLIDIVKNYRQYGYDENLRNDTLEILKKRGIDKEQLILTGNYKNQNYDSAKDIYESFNRNSKKALILYGVVLLMSILTAIISSDKLIFLSSAMLIINLILIGLFIIFLIKSMINQSQFHKAIGKKNDSEFMLIFLVLGISLYFILYFYFRNKMNEQMSLIE